MARPQKKTVDYFPHYAVAGKTLLILQNEYGNNGYAFWFKLLSLLCKTDGQVYDYNNYASWKLLLAETQVSEDIAENILQILADIDAIDKELHSHKVVWVQNLVDNLEDVYSRRTNGSTPTRPVIVDNNVLLGGVNVSNNLVNVSNKPQTKLNNTKLNNTTIYSFWNNQNIIKHQKLTDDIKRGILIALKDNTEKEIVQAIRNYAEILKGDNYYFKYSWTLKDFLKRGLVKFLDLDIAKNNYLKDSKNGTHKQGAGKLPKTYTHPDELRHEIEDGD